MNTSVRWLNEYLEPAGATPDEIDAALTDAGFPIEVRVDRDGGDVMLDVEVTSNRGDCLCHVGLAREVAALTGRALKLPAIPDGVQSDDVRSHVAVENRVGDHRCPRFTAQVIRGVKVGPSPDWLVRALEAVGQRSINNVVDVTNWLTFEFGQPSHVFDLATLGAGSSGTPTLVIREAAKGESLKLLDGRTIKLVGGELLVADGAGKPISLAGVMGGAETEVGEGTTDVVLEAATWDPVCVRTAARRFDARTDASFRFERIVDQRTIDAAARRAAALIVEVAGGELVGGMIAEGRAAPGAHEVRLRLSQVERLLGLEIAPSEIEKILRAHEIGVTRSGDGEALGCEIPAFRPDLTREIDLIEEIARTHGLKELPLHERVGTRIAAPQARERARREMIRVLTGQGFFETMTFSFVSHDAAAPFLAPEMTALELSDERRKADPVIRPSVLPSLLACRKGNQNARVSAAGGVRLFEVSSVFAGMKGGGHAERQNLTLLADCIGLEPGAKGAAVAQGGVRIVRGAIESLVTALHGAEARVRVEPAPDVPMKGYDPAATGSVLLDGERIGVIGLLSGDVQKAYDLDAPVVGAELNLDALLDGYPPKSLAHELPEFPGIERDLSLVVGEDVTWGSVEAMVAEVSPALLEGVRFVGTYRGKQVGAGKKSLTMRLGFRDPSRTLRHEEVDPQVEAVVAGAKDRFGAELRA